MSYVTSVILLISVVNSALRQPLYECLCPHSNLSGCNHVVVFDLHARDVCHLSPFAARPVSASKPRAEVRSTLGRWSTLAVRAGSPPLCETCNTALSTLVKAQPTLSVTSLVRRPEAIERVVEGSFICAHGLDSSSGTRASRCAWGRTAWRTVGSTTRSYT
jgi:hypothetical protein